MTTPRVQSVGRAFSLLAHLGDGQKSNQLAALAQRTGLTVATAHRLLSTLESLGLIVRTGSDGYQIGMMIHQLAEHRSVNEILSATVAATLRKLVRETGFTAHAGVLNEDSMVDYVAKAAPGRGYQVPTRLGSQLEAYCSGLGKVLLSGLSEPALEKYLLDAPFVPLTSRTITVPELLRQEIDHIRVAGYAVDEREIFDQLRCVAVPVFGHGGKIVAAVSVSADDKVLTRDRVPDLAALLRSEAALLSRKLFPVAYIGTFSKPSEAALATH